MEDFSEKISLEIKEKRFVANKLEIFFGSKQSRNACKVLTLSNIVAFRDFPDDGNGNYSLQVRYGGGSYALDIASRLKNYAYADYPEIFLVVEQSSTGYVFRAIAAQVDWADIKY